MLPIEHVIGLSAVGRSVHREIGVPQGTGKPVGQHRIVFNDEDAQVRNPVARMR